jgi:hypothetical protein
VRERRDVLSGRGSAVPDGRRTPCLCAQARFANHARAHARTHPGYLNTAADLLFKAVAPLRLTLPLARAVVAAAEDARMRALWRHSALARGGRDRMLRRMREFVEDVPRALDAGRVQLDAVIMPEGTFEGQRDGPPEGERVVHQGRIV